MAMFTLPRMINPIITELLIAERDKLQERLQEINALIGGHNVVAPNRVTTEATDAPKKRRTMSAAARAKIAAAQRARWAKQKRGQ